MRAVVAVDIGGTGVRAGVLDESGRLESVERQPLARDVSEADLLTRIRDTIESVRPDGEVVLGIAIPSFVLPDGTIGECPALRSLEGLNLSSLLGDATTTVRVVPDLAAAALGESRHGSGRGVTRFICTALGTGVNAAAVVDGVLVETAFGCLGDAGHVIVDPDGPECACGGRGCLESIASGFALARAGAPLGLRDGKAVIEAARSGNPEAVTLVERAGVALGRAVATWSALLWPERVAVAGGLSAAGDLLLEPARAELARVGVPYIIKHVELVQAELGADATLLGAGLAVSEL